jgi:signal transduction histidine kinase
VNFRQEHALSDQDIRSLYRISELATIILLWGGLEALVAKDRPTPAAPVVFAADADLRTAVTTLRDLTGDRDGLLGRCESLTYDTTQYLTSLADRWSQLLEQGEIRPANFNRLLFRALDQVSMPANIEVVKKCAADLPPLVLNEAQLIEAFAVLITNAVEAIAPRPGQIILHSRLSDDEREVIFEIEDTGIGMSEEVQRRAFEPLFTTKAPKSAPGLWFCRALLQNLEGDLTIGHSEMGKGSAFTITLPSRR